MSCFSLKTRCFIFCVTAAIFSVEMSQTSLTSYGKEKKNKMSTTLLNSQAGKWWLLIKVFLGQLSTALHYIQGKKNESILMEIS